MRVLGLLPCVALNFLAVTGFRLPARVCCASCGDIALWPRCSIQQGSHVRSANSKRSIRTRATTSTMKVESAPDPDRYRDALTTTALAVTGAAGFGAGINQFLGADKALQYFAGYVVEMSLSVDNLFVFLLLFRFFKVRVCVSKASRTQ